MAIKQEALAASQTYKGELINAQKISKANPSLAISKIDALLSQNTENNLTDDALFLKGTLMEKVKNPRGALASYSKILSSRYASPLDGRALIKKANLLSQMGSGDQALRALDYIKYNKLIDTNSLAEIESMRSPLLIKSGRHMDYLYSANNIILKSKDKAKTEPIYRQALDVMKIKLDDDETKQILNDPSLRLFHPQAALNLTEYYFENGQPELAVTNLENYSHLLDDPEYQNKKNELLVRGHVFTSPNKDVIGVIIPLSGKYQYVGQQILKGLQFSFDLWSGKGKTKFKLAVMDSEGDPTQVALAFDELMKNDKPIAVIGGLVSRTAGALLMKSDEYKVPALILSQKEGLTDQSRYGFQNSQSIEIYTDLIASIAIDILKVTKVAVVHSNKSFSSRYATAFTRSFIKKGGEITQQVEYDLSEKRAIPNAVKRLIGLLTIEGREEEYEIAMKKWRKTARARGNGSPKLEEILKPKVEFEALFVADGAKNGGLIASTLAYFDVEDVKLMGTHLWNDSDLLERGQRFVENSVFASSYFEPSILSSNCGREFQAKFQEPINPYIFRGIETGVIINSIYSYFKIESRKSLLTALKKTSTITHKCLPQGLVRDDHNFVSPLVPLTVIEKSIVLLKEAGNSTKQNQGRDF